MLLNEKPEDVVVGLEDYTKRKGGHKFYGATAADRKLKELGGCLRRDLCLLGHFEVMEIPPSNVKKIFCNQGQAKKQQMVDAYHEVYNMPNLLQALNINHRSYKNVPKGVDDLVDSFAVAMCTIHYF